jgi:hypothetical protein
MTLNKCEVCIHNCIPLPNSFVNTLLRTFRL